MSEEKCYYCNSTNISKGKHLTAYDSGRTGLAYTELPPNASILRKCLEARHEVIILADICEDCGSIHLYTPITNKNWY